jgi:ribonuclease HII
MSSKTFPNLSLEQTLFDSGAKFVLGIDEVGRGSVAGPVAVGVTVLSPAKLNEPWPAKLRDSKLISEKVREELFAPTAGWVTQWAVGMASAKEIDDYGIVWALEASAKRAVDQLQIEFDSVMAILDGSHNWLSRAPFHVHVQPKADRDCASVAAASVLAKVTRDRLMVELAESVPGYGFEGHKGYASAGHIAAIRDLGPSSEHRVTWLTRILADGSEAVGSEAVVQEP